MNKNLDNDGKVSKLNAQILQKVQLNRRSYIPKKYNKMSPPKQYQKVIQPNFTHFAQMHTPSNLRISQIMDFDKWAYIPNKTHKKMKNLRIKTTIEIEKSEQTSEQKLNRRESQSINLFKTYQKRKKHHHLEDTKSTFYTNPNHFLRLIKEYTLLKQSKANNKSKAIRFQSSNYQSPQERKSASSNQSLIFLIKNSIKIKQEKFTYDFDNQQKTLIKKRFSLHKEQNKVPQLKKSKFSIKIKNKYVKRACQTFFVD